MIVKKTVPGVILEELRKMIAEGAIREGQKFPNQNTLAAQLGVSRSSLREALHTLTVIGAIEQKPGVGMILKTRLPLMLMDSLDLPVLPEEQATLELLEVRRVAESNMVPLAVIRGTDEEIKELEDIYQRMERYSHHEKLTSYVRLDLLFHNALAKMSHNRYYQFIFTGLQHHLTNFLTASFQLTSIAFSNSLGGHKLLVEAARTRDKDMAVKAINLHLDQVEEAVHRFYHKQA